MNGLITIFLASCAGGTVGCAVALLVRRCSERERRRHNSSPPAQPSALVGHAHLTPTGLLWTLDKPTGRPMTWRDPR